MRTRDDLPGTFSSLIRQAGKVFWWALAGGTVTLAPGPVVGQQRGFGFCAGLNLATQEYHEGGKPANAEVMGLGRVGLTWAVDMTANTSFQPELLVSLMGMRHSLKRKDPLYKDQLTYMMLPLVVVGRIPMGKGLKRQLAFGGGPYVSWLVNARRDSATVGNRLQVGNRPGAFYRAIDAGLSTRIAYETGPFFLAATYSFGMVNVQANGDGQNYRYNRCVSLTTGFRIRVQDGTAPRGSGAGRRKAKQPGYCQVPLEGPVL